MKFIGTSFILSILTVTLFLMNNNDVYAQQTLTAPSEIDSVSIGENQESLPEQKKLPALYVHLFGGMGFSYYSSKDAKSLLDDYGIGIGLPTWSYGVRGGLWNIFQVEYNIGKSNHDFNKNTIIPDEPNKVVKMDYKTNDIQFKINPFFWKQPQQNRAGLTKAFFLVGGFGDVEWFDEADDGFHDGKSSIVGIEYALISKNISTSVSFKRYGIEFDRTTLLGIPFDNKVKASDYILEIKIGLGLGGL